jgi:hypothetical protein
MQTTSFGGPDHGLRLPGPRPDELPISAAVWDAADNYGKQSQAVVNVDRHPMPCGVGRHQMGRRPGIRVVVARVAATVRNRPELTAVRSCRGLRQELARPFEQTGQSARRLHQKRR